MNRRKVRSLFWNNRPWRMCSFLPYLKLKRPWWIRAVYFQGFNHCPSDQSVCIRMCRILTEWEMRGSLKAIGCWEEQKGKDIALRVAWPRSMLWNGRHLYEKLWQLAPLQINIGTHYMRNHLVQDGVEEWIRFEAWNRKPYVLYCATTEAWIKKPLVYYLCFWRHQWLADGGLYAVTYPKRRLDDPFEGRR